MTSTSFLQQELQRRPWWMNILFVWCAILAIGVPFELLSRPVAEDIEVWFGFELTGWLAKGGGLLHVLLFTAGTWGFWKIRAWMWPWASVYVAQVAISHLVWSELSPDGRGWRTGLIQAVGISIIGVLLWRARPLFQKSESPSSASTT